MTVEEGLSIYFHADIVAAGGEEAADDAGSVGVFAADDGFAPYVVAHLAHHGIETEVADVDAVAYGGLVGGTILEGGVADAHDVDRVGDALHQTVEVIEVVEGAVVFDIVVAAAIGVDGNLYVGEAKAAADDLVEGAVAATPTRVRR